MCQSRLADKNVFFAAQLCPASVFIDASYFKFAMPTATAFTVGPRSTEKGVYRLALMVRMTYGETTGLEQVELYFPYRGR